MKAFLVLAAVASFGIVLSAALVIAGQRFSARPVNLWLRAVILGALSVAPVLVAIEAVAR